MRQIFHIPPPTNTNHSSTLKHRHRAILSYNPGTKKCFAVGISLVVRLYTLEDQGDVPCLLNTIELKANDDGDDHVTQLEWTKDGSKLAILQVCAVYFYC